MLTAHTFFLCQFINQCGKLLPLWHAITDIVLTTKSPATFFNRAIANSQSVGCKNWPQKHYRAAGNCSWSSELLPPTTVVLFCWFGERCPFSFYIPSLYIDSPDSWQRSWQRGFFKEVLPHELVNGTSVQSMLACALWIQCYLNSSCQYKQKKMWIFWLLTAANALNRLFTNCKFMWNYFQHYLADNMYQ